MKVLRIIIVFWVSSILFISCDKDSELELVGNVIISIDNQTLSNQSDFFVEAGIVFLESDDGTLIDFGRNDISQGRMLEFGPFELNAGNYYLRYRYFSGNSTWGSERHKPFQVQAGEDNVVEIIR